jgi:hypothetical protein
MKTCGIWEDTASKESRLQKFTPVAELSYITNSRFPVQLYWKRFGININNRLKQVVNLDRYTFVKIT